MEERIFFTLPGLDSDPSVTQPEASRYTDYAIPAPDHIKDERKFVNDLIERPEK
jgi:hypothetical protein